MEKVRKFFVMVSIMILLLPVLSFAGDLEPSGPPAPTMKSLDKIPPAWSQKLQCDTTACPRFELVFDDRAVLDKETGLVWERTLDTAYFTWLGAAANCHNLNISMRKGWHLPTIEQISSLYDSSNNPTLPVGHPFIGVKLDRAYWSATTMASVLAENSSYAWCINFSSGLIAYAPKSTFPYYVWCVRGGQTYDGH